ncbi:MAG: lactonase family protein [Alphaproteobacteria bacterium]|nr:lactonase family protein [Alphaproteobacteria bacterium]
MFAYVGSFTTANRKARGNGINVFRVDPATGAWTHVQHVGDLVNPSFLALSHDRRHLYAVHGDADYATSFAVDAASGRLTLLNRGRTGGLNGVKQDFDRAGRFMVVANYVAGNVAVLAIRPDGSLADQHDLLSLSGAPGPHRTEQTKPHPHDVVFDPGRRYVLIPDKGLDAVFVLRFDDATGRIALHDTVASRPGAGPRHAAFHPTRPFAYVCNELDSTVTAYRWEATRGVLAPLQVVSSLPEDFFGANTTAEILVSRDGRFVYCSNRGHDSVAIYAVDAGTGKLAAVGWEKTQGRDPRFIGIEPNDRFLYATNEQGDSVVAFAIDAASGRLRPAAEPVRLGSPVTIAFSAP